MIPAYLQAILWMIGLGFLALTVWAAPYLNVTDSEEVE